MTDIDDIRNRMRTLADQARRALALHDAGTIGGAECLEVAAEMRAFMAEVTTQALDLADRAEAIGDRRRAEELYQTAMGIEAELLRDMSSVIVGRPRRAAPSPR
jgi:hypothetical protein